MGRTRDLRLNSRAHARTRVIEDETDDEAGYAYEAGQKNQSRYLSAQPDHRRLVIRPARRSDVLIAPTGSTTIQLHSGALGSASVTSGTIH